MASWLAPKEVWLELGQVWPEKKTCKAERASPDILPFFNWHWILVFVSTIVNRKVSMYFLTAAITFNSQRFGFCFGKSAYVWVERNWGKDSENYPSMIWNLIKKVSLESNLLGWNRKIQAQNSCMVKPLYSDII